MSNNIQHIFCGAMTADGSPVNQTRTTDNRKISKMLNDQDGGYYARVKQSDLAHAFKDCAVYVWVSENE